MLPQCTIRFLIFATVMLLVSSARAADMELWYRQPAGRWEEALPVGNGHLGAMIYGGVQRERIALSETTLWTGRPSARSFDPRQRQLLQRQRDLVLRGKYEEADSLKLIDSPAPHPATRPVQPDQGSPLYPTDARCAFQPLGDLYLHMAPSESIESDYRRDLDLDTAIATVTWRAGDATFRREIFCSHPDQVMVVRLTCTKPGRISFTATMDRIRDVKAHVDRYATSSEFNAVHSMTPPPSATFQGTAPGRAVFRGQCEEGGIRFESHLQLIADSGETMLKPDGIVVRAADSATLLIAAASSYRGDDPAQLCQARLQSASAKSYAQLRDAHVADHQQLFRRVELDLGRNDMLKLPTDRRLSAVQLDVRDPRDKKIERDPQLFTLYFQFGRYLMIAGSRRDSPLPLNLQGIWNDSLLPPWFGLYTSDINQEMNYWPAEVCNLSECHEPQLAFLEYLAPAARTAARDGFGCRGLVINGLTPFGTKAYTSNWQDAAGWLAEDFWEHYAFSPDRQFLAGRAYPFMKDCALFYLDFLTEHPTKHWLVTAPVYSPENTFISPAGRKASLSASPTLTLGIIRDLFVNTLRAATILDTDPDFRRQLNDALKRLPPLQIGKHGQLQEWLEDFDEVDPGHRHVSHLYPLYPGQWITPRGTPDLAKAAHVAIERRIQNGGGWTGWSSAWLLNCAARLEDGQLAHDRATTLLRKCTFPNLFDTHPRRGGDIAIFQIDGNLGATAGIAEMLLQSHAGEIHLLPALPREWPAGSVKGLCARGGFVIDIRWKNGVLDGAVIQSASGGVCTIRFGQTTTELTAQPGERITLDGKLKRK